MTKANRKKLEMLCADADSKVLSGANANLLFKFGPKRSLAAYVRATTRSVLGATSRTLEVARVTAEPTGTGMFNQWLDMVESVADEHYRLVYVENVMEPGRLGLFLRRRGYIEVGREPGATKPMSYVRKCGRVRTNRKSAGRYDYSGSCAPKPWERGSVYYGQTTFSLGVFQWQEDAERPGKLRRGPVVTRIKGSVYDVAKVYEAAEAWCDNLDKVGVNLSGTRRVDARK